MNDTEKYSKWPLEQGVQPNGVKPLVIPNKGLGIVATKNIKPGDLLVTVPAKAIYTIDSPLFHVEEYKDYLRGTVHNQLAIGLVLGSNLGSGIFQEWLDVSPTLADFKASVPLLWPEHLQRLLPLHAKELLRKQKVKFGIDFESAKTHFVDSYSEKTKTPAGIIEDAYTRSWWLVNTRSFYWDYPSAGSKENRRNKQRTHRPPIKCRDDCMALCPFNEYFNHADGNRCEANYSYHSYTIHSDREYQSGEELHLSYGKHNNEFLLVEYGFMMDPNSSDLIYLDQGVLERISPVETAKLEEQNLLGEYTLSPGAGVCHRTQCALMLLVLPATKAGFDKWTNFVNGVYDGADEQRKVDEECAKMLEEMAQVCKQMADIVSKAEPNKDATNGEEALLETKRRNVVGSRWLHVEKLLKIAAADLQTKLKS